MAETKGAETGGVGSIKKRIFRQAALERLSTPEQLDQLVILTGRGTWAATLALWILLGGVMLWAWLGAIPDYAEADGLLVSGGGGVVDATAPAVGRVLALRVQPGDLVSTGQVLAELDQAELARDLKHAKERQAERQERLEKLTADFAREKRISEDLRRQQRDSLTRLRAAAQERRDYLKTSLDNLDGLSARGLSTREAVADTRQRYYEADRQIQEADTEIIRLDQDAFALEERQDRERRDAEDLLSAARREVDERDQELTRATRVTAPVAGRVTEVKAPAGAFVNRGQGVVSLESGKSGLEAVLFLLPATGKDVRVGQQVRLQPANIKKEEFGSIEGEVLSVSAFPVTPDGVRAILRNDSLVAQFTRQGAPYLARISLEKDSSTVSGLKWTSGAGPGWRVDSGSVLTAEITIRERAPISLVIPFLRKHTGVGF
ncbi:NHLP bacteriocin system secretion protein [Rhodospirillum sp. A1_3_36]|uniref:NHLP bacteriocin system secretion protein n=1 Tax=Rhodospirillum sp. A1_3_36 TaxID=3391666 RepID=UPI0039A64DDE